MAKTVGADNAAAPQLPRELSPEASALGEEIRQALDPHARCLFGQAEHRWRHARVPH